NDQPLVAPRELTALANATKQIRLTASAVNGAEGYKFYQTPGKNGAASDVLTSEGTVLTVDGLTPGVTYTFRVTAYRTENGSVVETAPTEAVSVTCHTIVSPPENFQGKVTGTGQVTLHWDLVPGAQSYKIYRYLNHEELEVAAQTTGNYYDISGMYPGYKQYFRVTAVSADGYESKFAPQYVECYCGVVDGDGRRTAGDIDFNGKLESGDARIALRVSVGLESLEKGTDAFRAADADKNGKLEAADARLILRASVGLERLA
ncbi:MAG: hypothetical protein IJK98_04875, partial [Clostridia bacterium]|nr:hypothetical protein [Clostridia bacterium]